MLCYVMLCNVIQCNGMYVCMYVKRVPLPACRWNARCNGWRRHQGTRRSGATNWIAHEDRFKYIADSSIHLESITREICAFKQ